MVTSSNCNGSDPLYKKPTVYWDWEGGVKHVTRIQPAWPSSQLKVLCFTTHSYLCTSLTQSSQSWYMVMLAFSKQQHACVEIKT